LFNTLSWRVIWLVAGLMLSGLGAQGAVADNICGVPAATPAPAVTLTVSCDQAAISRYFLLSPALAALPAAQRADVISEPVRYAFIYMSADAVNRLQAAFANPAVQSVDLTETLMARTATGQPAPHAMFRVVAARADVAGINWSTLAPPDLFKTVPSQLSPFLIAALKADSPKP
jgi:hypothetical protein